MPEGHGLLQDANNTVILRHHLPKRKIMNSDQYILTASQIFTLLFVMLGPVHILAPFAKATHAMELSPLRRLSFHSTVLSFATLLIAGFVGRALLERWVIPAPIML